MKRKLIQTIIIAAFVGAMTIGSLTGCQKIASSEPTCSKQESEYPNPDAPEFSIDKPVIYLYGYDSEDVTINLSFNGNMTMTYPETVGNTWSVKAEKDGTLKIGDNSYRYLFWEGKSNTTWSFKKGFCVKGSETVSFLEKELTKLGLNTQEKEDFITYWAPQMIKNNYNVISFQTKLYTDSAKLTCTPAPDKTFRIFMAWYGTDKPVDIPEQSLTVPKRAGKVLVEWGGTKVDPEIYEEKEVVKDETSSDSSKKNEDLIETQTAPTKPVQTPTVTDPYAQYGTYAQCAKDWDNTAAKKCGKTWAQLDAGTRGAAYNHWIGHGTSGW